MEELKSDYHNANSYPLNDLDQTTSTTHLSQEKKQRTPLKPVVQHYLKALIKITRLETKSYSSFGVATKKQRNPWNYMAQQRRYQIPKLFGTTEPI